MHRRYYRSVASSLLVSAALLGMAVASAEAQTGSITYLGPSGGTSSAGSGFTTSDSGSLFIECDVYAAASEPWDTVEADVTLSWPGGSVGPQIFYAQSGGGGTSISANVPYGDANEDVSCNLNVNSEGGLGSYSTGATYTIMPGAPSDLRISSDSGLIWDFQGQGGGYHRDVVWQFYALNGGIYFATNNIRERYVLGTPGSLGNTCNIPSIATNPNAVTLQNGQFSDRYGVQPTDTQGFIVNICQTNPNCQTLTMQYIRVEAGDGTQIGSEWPIHVNFYCAKQEVYR
jgi:hypothetical protein